MFLHYVPITQINWSELTGRQQGVIAILPVVIRELDRQKIEHPKEHIRRRAAQVLSKLDELSESTTSAVRDAWSIDFVRADAQIDFGAHNLVRHIQDDQIIASAVELRASGGADTVILVTADFGLKLKARTHEFTAITPADKYRHPNETDPRDAKIRELQQEVQRLGSRRPSLALVFADSTRQLTVPVRRVAVSETVLARELEEIRRKHSPYTYPEAPGTSVLAARAFIEASRVNPADVQRYNEALPAFYEQYEFHVRERAEYEAEQSKIVKLSIELTNSGTSPAEDIDVQLHFPDGFLLTDSEQEVSRQPMPPEPPSYPKSSIQRIMEQCRNAANPLAWTRDISIPSPRNASAFEIVQRNSYDVTVHVSRLKHSNRQALDPLYVVFDSCESASSFGIDYSIHAAELPDAQKGRLDVIVENGA